jgi:ribosomal protein S18 acetylase RimI-like enzyme
VEEKQVTIEINQIGIEDVRTLQKITIETFKDTFGESNSEADLKQYFTESCNLEKLSDEIINSNSFFYFIYYKHQLAGYLKVNVDDAQTEDRGNSSLEIERIYILSSYKRLGLGRRLLNQAESLAKNTNKTIIWLGVWENNIDAQHFYSRFGFKEVGAHHFLVGTDLQRDLIFEKITV